VPEKKQCCWRTGAQPRKYCQEEGIKTFRDSGMTYCKEHFVMVENNRDWLLWKYSVEKEKE
jgi:hypothetical protein